MQKLHAQNILIWGATGTIGSAVAQAFATKGFRLILTGRHMEKLEPLADVCEAKGASCLLVPMKFKNLFEIDELAVHLAQSYKKLDGMISCLGTLQGLGSIHHVEEKDYHQAFHVNVTLNWKALQACESLLIHSGRGVALFPIEELFKKPQAYHSVYGLTKRTLAQLIEQFSLDNANSSLVAQTLFLPQAKTPLTQKIFPSLLGDFASSEDIAKKVLKAYEDLKNYPSTCQAA
jgi:short-subunit dehydrogenase